MINKILIVALKYSYGKKKFGPSINKGALIDSFNNLGYNIKTIWIDQHKKDLLNKLIIDKAESFQPDLIFFKLFKNEICSDTLLRLKKSFKTINWFGDDPWRFNSFSKFYAKLFTYVITTDKYSVNLYKKSGQEKVIVSQHGSFSSSCNYKKVDYKYDISFVGTKSAYRNWFIRELSKKGFNCVCFGKGWRQGVISYAKMQNIFQNSKINLNINNSVSYDLRVNFYNPRNVFEVIKSLTLNNRKVYSRIKARNFEIPVFGGFQLTDYVIGIEDYFKIGEEILCYKDVEDAASLIEYFLTNELEREIIKNYGVVRARNCHTFTCRMKEIVDNISSFN